MTDESLARLLGIKEWKIIGEPFCVEESGRSFAMVEIVREKGVYQCSCGRRFTIYYDGEEREVRDLSWGKWNFSLLFFQVRVDCPECGVKTEHLDWLVPGSRYRKRFAMYVAQLCRLATVSAVAKHLGLDWKTVKRAEEQDKAVLKGTKYLLLRNWDNLKDEQKDRLAELLDLNENLNIVYILKEELKQLWNYKYPGAAWNFFLKWFQTTLESNIEPLIQLGTMLYNHWEGIAAHCRYPIHTSVLEGMNDTAKVIKRVAYGFRDTAYFFLKLRSAFPGKEPLAYES